VVNGPGSGGRESGERLGRLGRRLSVWHYLVAIALPPSIGVAAIAGLVAAERVATARDARSIERSMETIQRLDHVRQAVDAEATASAAADTLVGLGVPPEQARQVAAFVAPKPVAELRKATDAAVVAVRADPATAAPLAVVTRRLAAAREPPDAPGGAGARRARSRAWETIVEYRQLLDVIADDQRDVAIAIAAGGRGVGSPATLRAAVRLADVSDVVLLSSRRLAVLYLAYLAPPDELPQVRARLRDVDAQYRSTVFGLETRLSPPLRQQWRAMRTMPLVSLVDGYVSRNIEALTAGRAASARPQDLTGTSRAVNQWNARASLFLTAAVREGTAAAAADRSAANRRAALTVTLTAVLLVVTLGVIAVLGGLMRRRFGAVAAGAKRLSSGRLEPMPVRGPREAADAATGLNDAVANLLRVRATVEHLVAGDLEAPELQEPTPGRLGTAVHASVELLTDAIRERERLQLELEYRASHDALTGLPNRTEAERLLEGALEDTRAGAGPAGEVGALFVDLDHFKQINDTHGHHAGDHVLQVAASRMRAEVSPGGTVCRLGGDEFVVILAGTAPEDLTAIGERLVVRLAEPITYQGTTVRIGASIGAALSGPAGETADDLLACADRAAYRAKAAGRGRLALAH
jgi:diguanylate cyclase (GGDEF)-like protein